MKLNGWVRLWIVLSVCWLGLAGYNAYSSLSWMQTKKRYEVSKENIGSAQFLFSAAQSDSEIEEYIKNELTPEIEKNPKNYVGKTDDTPYKQYIENHFGQEVTDHLLFGLLPVLGLFFVGWSFAWVKRGFSGKPNT